MVATGALSRSVPSAARNITMIMSVHVLEPVLTMKKRMIGDVSSRQTLFVCATLPDGRDSDSLSDEPWTWYGSFPCAIFAPPLRRQVLVSDSSAPPGARM